MHDTYVENTVGAVIFFTYIAAALFFSAFISRDLISLYRKCGGGSPKIAESRRKRAVVFISLASVSFAALSYHMLSFLIQSYSVWARRRSIATPEVLYGFRGLFGSRTDRIALHAWEWSKQSTLFRDFAQNIVSDPRRYWWTQLALLYSLGWNMYMAVEGINVSANRTESFANKLRSALSNSSFMGILCSCPDITHLFYTEPLLYRHFPEERAGGRRSCSHSFEPSSAGDTGTLPSVLVSRPKYRD